MSPLRAQPKYQPLGLQSWESGDGTYTISTKPVPSSEREILKFDAIPKVSLGQPARKPLIDTLDVIAVVISLACFTIEILVTTPRLHLAYQLAQDNQIILLGLLLGITNQCTLRVFPYFLLLLESRIGRSSLQNYAGLLRWSPWSAQLSISLRSLLVVLVSMPLILSVLYKKCVGGFSSIESSGDYAWYTPTGPPGLQGNIPTSTIFANATAPLVTALDDTVPFNSYAFPFGFGFNTLILSNTSAAALDGPMPQRVLELQSKLIPGARVRLTASVRGTVAQYNQTTGDRSYWNQARPDWGVVQYALWNSYMFGVVPTGFAGNDDARTWNMSWVLAGTYKAVGDSANSTIVGDAFLKTAMRFDIKRYNCTGTWDISWNSIEIISGSCNRPLDEAYQYFHNCQTGLTDKLGRMMADYLGPFGTTRNASHWLFPTYAGIIASAFHATVSGYNGIFAIQPAGPFYFANGKNTHVHEYYYHAEQLTFTRPTLKFAGALITILAIQPAMTIIAFIGIMIMFDAPIGRNFGLVAIMAGVDRDTMDLLAGSALSGETKTTTRLRINVLSSRDGKEPDRIAYQLGDAGANGKIKMHKEYQ